MTKNVNQIDLFKVAWICYVQYIFFGCFVVTVIATIIMYMY